MQRKYDFVILLYMCIIESHLCCIDFFPPTSYIATKVCFHCTHIQQNHTSIGKVYFKKLKYVFDPHKIGKVMFWSLWIFWYVFSLLKIEIYYFFGIKLGSIDYYTYVANLTTSYRHVSFGSLLLLPLSFSVH